ncbi:MAG: tRNA pseudouridine(55) synthase TruB [Bacteroidales bacterium]|jgi:tRNA pseudouridine55 synthase|nr:tRNA pseudouridine(55) synthase TruB [Bacteroidales bacterium]
MTTKQADFHFEQGEIILIDKPLDWTSFDVVNFIRSLIKRFHQIHKLKVGHAGTLDPLATGLLIICTGKMTKQIQQFQDQSKHYTGTFRVGETTPSCDKETEVDGRFPTEHITAELLESVRKQFLGLQQQFPPIYSAVKVDGKRAFKYAREQKEVKLASREVEIYDFQIDAKNFPELAFSVHCSKGTYIRSLAFDFGKALESGAYLTSLRRTHIGDFSVDNAVTPEAYKAILISTSTLEKEE